MWQLLMTLALVGAQQEDAASNPGCLDGDGKPVDFYYVFKYNNGEEYAYMDSNTKLTKQSDVLDSMTSAVSQTLKQAYSKTVNRVFYNDEHPDGKTQGKPHAHAKGVLSFGSTGGFWLVHSLPAFPNTGNDASKMWEADSGKHHEKYGQNFFCVNLDKETIEALSKGLKIEYLCTYDTQFTSAGEKAFPTTVDWATQKRAPKGDDTMEQTITSKGGQKFTVFSKAGHWDDDLYEHFVGVKLGKLYMEGWRNGAGGVQGPACQVTKGKAVEVLDVMHVKFPDGEWKVSQDHSKWVVTQDGKNFCACGMNRFTSQEPRGGGCVCIEDSDFAGQISDTITETDHCGKGEVLV